MAATIYHKTNLLHEDNLLMKIPYQKGAFYEFFKIKATQVSGFDFFRTFEKFTYFLRTPVTNTNKSADKPERTVLFDSNWTFHRIEIGFYTC